MTFAEPQRLWVFTFLILLAAGYVLRQKAKNKYALRYSSTELLSSIMPTRSGSLKHFSAGIFFAAFVLLIVAFAKPNRTVALPIEKATIIIALDVSLSMQAEDVSPNRFFAAQQAARDFVKSAPNHIDIGLVSFSKSARLNVAPTQDRQILDTAISRLELDESTALGDAIALSIDTLQNYQSESEAEQVSAIVLLSDGETTDGVSSELATQKAVAANIPISTISFGTSLGVIFIDDPDTEVIERQKRSVPVKEADLRRIAEKSNGTFFSASSLTELDEIYTNIGSTLLYEETQQEITDIFLAAGLLLLFFSSALNIFWFRQVL